MSESIEQIEDELKLVALKLGVSNVLAADLSRAFLDRMRTLMGGSLLYIPKPDKNSRNDRVISLFNGANHNEVCHELGISKATLYRILNAPGD